jgi:predicted acyl esterase
VLAATLLFCTLLPQDQDWQRVRESVAVPMRDGKHLAADVWLPPKPGRYPAILIQTPYGRKMTGARVLDAEHYAIVATDWRGFHGSKDARRGLGRPNLGADGYDTVEWVAAQSWCDGKVGTWGGSALAQAQFATAQQQPPHLVCCVPMISPLGQSYDRYYVGGVLREAQIQTLDRLGFGVGNLVRAGPRGDEAAWRIVERATRPDRIAVPVLLITGWHDLEPAAVIETWRELAPKARLLVGSWDHMSASLSPPAVEAARQFFDYWLRGQKDNGWEKAPPVRYCRLGAADQWIDANGFPGAAKVGEWSCDLVRAGDPVRAIRHDAEDPAPTLGGGNLPPLPIGPRDHRPLGERKDVVTLDTPPLDGDLVCEGSLRCTITFTCDRDDCDLAVRVCDVEPGGKAALVVDGIQRASRKGYEPGAECTLTVELPATAAVFGKGHTLRVYVSASNHPRFALNPKAAGATIRIRQVTLRVPAVRPG